MVFKVINSIDRLSIICKLGVLANTYNCRFTITLFKNKDIAMMVIQYLRIYIYKIKKLVLTMNIGSYRGKYAFKRPTLLQKQYKNYQGIGIYLVFVSFLPLEV